MIALAGPIFQTYIHVKPLPPSITLTLYLPQSTEAYGREKMRDAEKLFSSSD
jgi:hypothetical protein